MAARKSTEEQIVVYLIKNPGPVWRKDLIEGLGIHETNVDRALQNLRKRGIISISTKSRHRTLITLKRSVREVILDCAILQLRRAKKLRQITPISALVTCAEPALVTCAEFSCNSLNYGDLMELPDFQKERPIILNIITLTFLNSIFPFFFQTQNKTLPSPTWKRSDPEGGTSKGKSSAGDGFIFSLSSKLVEDAGKITQAVMQDLSSNNFNVSKLPEEKPLIRTPVMRKRIIRGTLLDCSREAIQEAARRSGALDHRYDVKKGSDFTKGEWKNRVELSEESCFFLYVGLHPVERDILCGRSWVNLLQEYFEIRFTWLIPLLENPTYERMGRGTTFPGIQRIRVLADSVNAPYPVFMTPEFRLLKANPQYIKNPRGILPQCFSGPMSTSVYEKEREELSKSDGLTRADVQKFYPDFLPENYASKNALQNQYYQKFMEQQVGFVARYNCRTIEEQITDYIAKGLIPQEFAEGPLNTLCPGFKYVKRRTFMDALRD